MADEDICWRFRLLGGLAAEGFDRTITRFRTHKTGALLGYLAYHMGRRHAREELIEALWPECDLFAGRNSLSVALSSLRRQLEPPDVPAGAVIVADRFSAGLNPATVTTDVAQFHSALAKARETGERTERISLLTQVVEIYVGELLPGYYEGWIPQEQQRIAELFSGCIREIIGHLEQAHDYERALQFCHRAVIVDPLCENAHFDLMRIYAAAEHPEAALRQYKHLQRILKQEYGDSTAAAVSPVITRFVRHLLTAPRTRHHTLSAKRNHARAEVSVPSPALAEVQAGGDAKGVTGRSRCRLPVRLSRFFGRQQELAQLQQEVLSGDVRLLTLTGAGGSGKTRLALELLDRIMRSFQGTICFVPLADITEASLIVEAALAALGQRSLTPGLEPIEQLSARLPQDPALLAFDNFEHLAFEGTLVIRDMLERLPVLTCLITSRHRLNIAGEREFSVFPLATPEGVVSPEQLVQCESVQLLVDRAQMVKPDFQVTAANASAIAELCESLEGIPLALELVAARAQVLTPAQMVAHLRERLDFFVSRQRDVPARHRNLRAAIDWSYNLLLPELKELFARLSVFRGGFTLETAAAVCFNRPDHRETLDGLAQLRECSLLIVDEHDDAVRYRMLETLREYAWERLVEQHYEREGDRAFASHADRMQQRHAQCYLRFLEERTIKIQTRHEALALQELDVELDNLRAAMMWALERTAPEDDEPDLAARLAIGLYPLLQRRGLWTEARQNLEAAANRLASDDTRVLTTIGKHLASLALDLGDPAGARARAEASLTLSCRQGDHCETAELLNLLGVLALDEGNHQEARCKFVEALNRLNENEYAQQGIVQHNLALLASRQGDPSEAKRLYVLALQNRRLAGDARGEAETLSNLGALAHNAGDASEAALFYAQGLEAYRALRYPYGIGVMLNNLGELAEREGNLEKAITLLGHAERVLAELHSADVRAPIATLQRIASQIGDEEFMRLRSKAGNVHWEDMTIGRVFSAGV